MSALVSGRGSSKTARRASAAERRGGGAVSPAAEGVVGCHGDHGPDVKDGEDYDSTD